MTLELRCEYIIKIQVPLELTKHLKYNQFEIYVE